MIDPSLMPELPEPRAIRAGHAFPKVYATAYTADQMREYFAQGYRIAMERAAQVCEDEKVEAEVTGHPKDYAYNLALRHAGDAIRALASPRKVCDGCGETSPSCACVSGNPALDRMARLDDELGEQP